jgi:hypothetical protein
MLKITKIKNEYEIPCDITSCNVVEVERCFGSVEVLRTSKSSDYFYGTARRHIPESSYVHTGHRENLKSDIPKIG